MQVSRPSYALISVIVCRATVSNMLSSMRSGLPKPEPVKAWRKSFPASGVPIGVGYMRSLDQISPQYSSATMCQCSSRALSMLSGTIKGRVQAHLAYTILSSALTKLLSKGKHVICTKQRTPLLTSQLEEGLEAEGSYLELSVAAAREAPLHSSCLPVRSTPAFSSTR